MSIVTQPTNQCTISNATGTISANVTNVSVTCGDPAVSFTLNGTAINSGDTLNFGSIGTSTSSGTNKDLSITITNSGASNLVLGTQTFSPSIPQFSIQTTPSTTIAPGASTTLTIRFASNTVNSYSSTLSFTTNSPANLNISFSLSGTAVDLLLSSLRAWLKLDGNLNDSSGNGNNGNITSGAPSYDLDRFGNANSVVIGQACGCNTFSIPGGTLTRSGSATYTIAFWVSLDTLSDQTFVSWTTLTIGSQNSDIRYVGSNLDVAIDSYSAGGWQTMLVTPNPALQANVWMHLTFVKDSTSIYIYQNGNFVQSTNLNANSLATTPNTNPFIFLGSGLLSPNFQGRMDDLRVYSIALSASQIAAIAN